MPVPGQVPAGIIDSYFREDPGDGTLGLPDYSPQPYGYAPLLGPAEGAPLWTVSPFRAGHAAYKGAPDGYGALRPLGQDNAAFRVRLVMQEYGLREESQDGTRAPQYTWGPRDAALAVRHPGTDTWTPADIRAYLALDHTTATVGMRLTTSAAEGPWDAEWADSAPVPLTPPFPDLWDGATHALSAAAFANHVLVLIDDAIALPMRAPRAYRRRPDGTTDTAVSAVLPATGSWGGVDARGEETFLFEWMALQPASGDFFSYDMSPTAIQVPPATTYTPTTLPSGETWTRSGTVTASKDGVLLAASSSMYFTPATPHGAIATRWGSVQPEGGLIFRRQSAVNYFLLTSTGVWRYEDGTSTKISNFAVAAGDHVVVHNGRSRYEVYRNGAWIDGGNIGYWWPTFGGMGFLSPATGTSQFRYLGFQPLPQPPVLPTV